MIDLSNKVTLITGGSRGIGAACVRAFHNVNSKVAFTYLNNDIAASNLKDSLDRQREVKYYKTDVSSDKDVKIMVESVLADFGRIDILVNNAGIWKFGEMERITSEEWDTTIDINLKGTFLVSRSVIPVMKDNHFGRIVNISSTAGQRGEKNYSHYAASKAGIIALTKSWAAELGHLNITVNSVAPGWVYTDMTTEVFADRQYEKQVSKEIPVGRIATAEDIAGPVLFLASDMARHVNGEVLNVNGGSVLCG